LARSRRDVENTHFAEPVQDRVRSCGERPFRQEGFGQVHGRTFLATWLLTWTAQVDPPPPGETTVELS